MNVLDEWVGEAARVLGVERCDDATRRLVLDVAKEVAHGVVRPGAPVSTYLLGVAVGRGADPVTAAAMLTELARSWPAGSTDAAVGNEAAEGTDANGAPTDTLRKGDR